MTHFRLDNLIEDWRKLLMLWSQTGALSRAAQEALRLPVEPEALQQLVGRWSAGDDRDLPPVLVVPESAMPNASGAYARSTGTIYLNQDWLREANPESVLAVLTEELGHHLDGLLNASDTPGDEGELFADLLLEVAVSEQELRRIKAEDDRSVAIIDGQRLEIEQAGRSIFNLPNPIGIAVDGDGNLLTTSFDGFFSNTIVTSKISPGGMLLNQVSYNGSIDDEGYISAIDGGRWFLQLQEDGDLGIIYPDNLSSARVLNLRNLQVDTSSIFHIATRTLGDMGGFINPIAFDTEYGDIAVLERGDRLDIFVSANSKGLFPFIMRIRYESGIFQSSKVIVASLLTGSFNYKLTRGVAVNKQGVVLTTLPIATGSIDRPSLIEVPVSFNADYPESGVGGPQIPLQGQGTPYIDGSNYVDFSSQGMTTDSAGNFYVVDSGPSSALGSPSGGTLIILPPTVSTVSAVLTEQYPRFFVNYRDVAVNSSTNQAFVTSSTGEIIAFALPDLKKATSFNRPSRDEPLPFVLDRLYPLSLQDPTGNPIRDFGGNPHGFNGSYPAGTERSYKYQGQADVNGNGNPEQVFTNRVSSRWGTVSVDPITGQIDYSRYGQGGNTRVVGIYIDPLVSEGEANNGFLLSGEVAPKRFGPFDSQQRFQNDLRNDNLQLRASADYNGDGLMETYWKTLDGTAYLRAFMHADGNIQYSNYQSLQQMTDFLSSFGYADVIPLITA